MITKFYEKYSDEKLLALVASLPGTDGSSRRLQCLTEIGYVVEDAMLIDVLSLRARNYSWARIANCLGLTRQGVYLKYRDVAKRVLDARYADPFKFSEPPDIGLEDTAWNTDGSHLNGKEGA